MSTWSQKPTENDVKPTCTEGPSCLETGPGETQPCQAKAARMRAIRELVRSDKYHIPAMLVAERMIERAVTQDDDRED